jgi:type I restriction enzyme S subunit
MTDGLKPYPESRDSGLPWLGRIPAHWDTRRNGRLFAQRIETSYADLPILEVSLKTGVRVRDFDNPTRKQVMTLFVDSVSVRKLEKINKNEK